MSEASDPFLLTQTAPARVLPLSKRTRDAVAPVVIALSVIVHATILIPVLFQGKKDVVAPTEIPIEIIQESPPPKAAQSPSTPPPPKPVPKQEPAKREPQKSQSQKSPEQAKQAEAQAHVAERMRKLLGQTPSLDPVAMPGESADGTDGVSYQQLVMSKLTKSLGFERRAGKPGFAVVTFVLDDHGAVASVTLDRPSGDPILDTEAIAVIKRGSPYPPPPPGGKRDYTVTLESRPIL